MKLYSELPIRYSSNMKARVADAAKVKLLRLGCTEPLGIPAWMLQYLATSHEFPVPPHVLLGLAREEDRHLGCDLVGEYFDCVGYRFSWGWIEERYSEETSDYGPSWRFEVFVDALLRKFPRADILEQIFGKMFDAHPLRCGGFDRSIDAWGTFTVLEFEVRTADAMQRLRVWMAETFVRHILPDLLATTNALVELAYTDRVRFDTEIEAWCAGKRDKDHLVRVHKGRRLAHGA